MPGASPTLISAALRIAARSLARQQAAPWRPGGGRRLCGHSTAARAAAVQRQQQQPPRAGVERLSLVVTSPSATQLLAGYFASELHGADCYLLYGGVGAGKSYFWCGRGRRKRAGGARDPQGHWLLQACLRAAAENRESLRLPPRPCSREFIRAAVGDEDLPVPSPTFLLQNIYDQPGAGFKLYAADPCPPQPRFTGGKGRRKVLLEPA